MIRREPLGIVAGIAPVELPALHGDLEDGPGARRGQRPDHQAGRADAADDAPLRRARAGGPPAGRAPGRDRRRRARRRPARAASVDPPRLAHGRHRDGEADREERGRHRQARPPRARRQGADGRARRRRPGHGRRGDQDRRLLQLRPGLHRLVARSSSPSGSTTTSSPRRSSAVEGMSVGDPGDRRRDRDGPRHLGGAAAARARLRRARRRREGDRPHRRRRGRRPRLLRQADDRHRRRAGRRDRAERGLRAGRDDAALRVRRRRDRDGERRPLRPRVVGLLGERRPRDEGRGAARLRHVSG